MSRTWKDRPIDLDEHMAHVEPNSPHTGHFGIERLQGSGRDDDKGRTHRYAGSVALAEAIEAFLEPR